MTNRFLNKPTALFERREGARGSKDGSLREEEHKKASISDMLCEMTYIRHAQIVTCANRFFLNYMLRNEC